MESARPRKTVFVLIFIFCLSVFFAPTAAAQNDIKLDLTRPSGYTAYELRQGLQSDLQDYAADFILAEKRYGINAVFLASVAALESGWGRYCHQPNNLFGWGQRSYPSKSACIDEVAAAMKEMYLTPGGRYFSGYSLYDVSRYYNNNGRWLQYVSGIMSEICSDIEENATGAVPWQDFLIPSEHEASSASDLENPEMTTVGGLPSNAFRF